MTQYCRGCGMKLDPDNAFCDLGMVPLANALVTQEELDEPETRYPLRPVVCHACMLVQLPALPPDLIFTERYPFFAGQSGPWHGHCGLFATQICERLSLGATSRVLEIGSNDGTMLRCFRGRGVPAVGVEPCENVAQHALMEGLATLVDFWGIDCARRLRKTQGVPTGKGWRADLVVATNVLAHVPDLQDFLGGVREILALDGTAVFEVANVAHLIREGQFDQIYAEHYSYFSLGSLSRALRGAGLEPVDAEELEVHGGSLRVYAELTGRAKATTPRYRAILEAERAVGLEGLGAYLAFATVPPRRKHHALTMLSDNSSLLPAVGYGASAKAISLLNYYGLGPETIEFIVDETAAKWGKYTPGSHIPIRTAKQLTEAQPGLVINFLWNWRRESEKLIRRACPDVPIIYLPGAQASALQKAA